MYIVHSVNSETTIICVFLCDVWFTDYSCLSSNKGVSQITGCPKTSINAYSLEWIIYQNIKKKLHIIFITSLGAWSEDSKTPLTFQFKAGIPGEKMPQSVILQPFVPMQFPPFPILGLKSIKNSSVGGGGIKDVQSHDPVRTLKNYFQKIWGEESSGGEWEVGVVA